MNFFKFVKHKKINYFYIISFCILLASCSSDNLKSTLQSHSSIEGIQDFGDPNAINLKQKAQALASHLGDDQKLIITQFGDSHSAADLFTGKVRNLLQDHFGNAGIGWVPPMTISGQYHTAVKWENKNWKLTSSRTQEADFPLGGMIATATKKNSLLNVIPTVAFDPNQEWLVKFWLKIPKSSALYFNENQKVKIPPQINRDKWLSVSLSALLPFSLMASENTAIGGFWFQKKSTSGVILSSIATNGAELSILDKWSPIWKIQLHGFESDLIILEFGTNESFNNFFSEQSYRDHLINKIRELRDISPQSAILLISPPDTLAQKDSNVSCFDRYPPHYHAIKRIQLEVAKSEKTLYWDWQKAMGGSCIMDNWHQNQLAQKDLIHLTRLGYEKTASIFYEDFLNFIQNSSN